TPNTAEIYTVSADGQNVNQIAGGLNGIQLITAGPGGIFGPNLFVASEGGFGIGDGNVSILQPNGALMPFLLNIDAASVAFDLQGILGVPGAMYVSDLVDDPNAASKIYRVTAVPEPSTLALLGVGTLVLIATRWRHRRCPAEHQPEIACHQRL